MEHSLEGSVPLSPQGSDAFDGIPCIVDLPDDVLEQISIDIAFPSQPGGGGGGVDASFPQGLLQGLFEKAGATQGLEGGEHQHPQGHRSQHKAAEKASGRNSKRQRTSYRQSSRKSKGERRRRRKEQSSQGDCPHHHSHHCGGALKQDSLGSEERKAFQQQIEQLAQANERVVAAIDEKLEGERRHLAQVHHLESTIAKLRAANSSLTEQLQQERLRVISPKNIQWLDTRHLRMLTDTQLSQQFHCYHEVHERSRDIVNALHMENKQRCYLKGKVMRASSGGGSVDAELSARSVSSGIPIGHTNISIRASRRSVGSEGSLDASIIPSYLDGI